MNSVANVYLWGTHIGAISMPEGSVIAHFQYTEEFRDMGVELSPICMPLGAKVFSFPELPLQTFHGLPGLVNDSLPDNFGNRVIAAWLREQNKSFDSLNSLAKLCYVGKRGMGALEYRPALFDKTDVAETVDVQFLSELAARVLKSREEVQGFVNPENTDYSAILKVGSSAGGARAKALIGWNETTNEVRSGQVRLPSNFRYWLMKFDGIEGNGDKEGDDKWGYGRVEYAYSLMARAAGIEMTACRLWNKRHFMTERFDRLPGGDKLHMQTLCALAHYDFNNPTLYSYEDAFVITQRLTPDSKALEQLYRRMVFNVLAWNCDDHVKNISYLMNRKGEWSLAPAYDMCYAYNPVGDWTSRHQMSVAGKRVGITEDDLFSCRKSASLRDRQARKIISEVKEAVSSWKKFADEAEVHEYFAKSISKQLEQHG